MRCSHHRDFSAFADIIIGFNSYKKAPLIDVSYLANRHIDLHGLNNFLVEISDEDGLSFSYGGDAEETSTKKEEYAELITDWMYNNDVETFKTSDIKALLRRSGWVGSEDQLYGALHVLQDEKIIVKEKRGSWRNSGERVEKQSVFKHDKTS